MQVAKGGRQSLQAATGCVEQHTHTAQMQPAPAQRHSMHRAAQRGDAETSQAQASLPCIPPLLRTKQGHGVQSRRACIASGCGASRGTSSHREKRTKGLKTIPVSRVTLCHANSPGANPIPGGQGRVRWPSRATVGHPLLPIVRAG